MPAKKSTRGTRAVTLSDVVTAAHDAGIRVKIGVGDIDPVNKPSHYTFGNVECIDAIQAQMTREEFIGFLRGQIAKYNWRLNHKGDAAENLAKLQWYAQRLSQVLA